MREGRPAGDAGEVCPEHRAPVLMVEKGTKMMKRNSSLIGGAVVLAGLGWAHQAAAEQPRATADQAAQVQAADYAYIFEDDPLAASGDVAAGLRIAVRPVGQRSLLIRPRTQFIQELFQSAENL